MYRKRRIIIENVSVEQLFDLVIIVLYNKLLSSQVLPCHCQRPSRAGRRFYSSLVDEAHTLVASSAMKLMSTKKPVHIDSLFTLSRHLDTNSPVHPWWRPARSDHHRVDSANLERPRERLQGRQVRSYKCAIRPLQAAIQ